MRVTNVLAPIDFSPPSKLALDYGVAFARAFHSNLTLLHVIDNMRVPPSQVQTEDVVRRMAELLSPEDKGDLDVRIIAKTGVAESEVLSTIREQNMGAISGHLGIQPTELVGEGSDPDGDGFVDEMTVGQVSALVAYQALLPLPSYVDSFGYQTARHVGAELVKNLMVDARTTSRWYFVVTAGRRAGHLALGIGKAAGATLTLIKIGRAHV